MINTLSERLSQRVRNQAMEESREDVWAKF